MPLCCFYLKCFIISFSLGYNFQIYLSFFPAAFNSAAFNSAAALSDIRYPFPKIDLPKCFWSISSATL
nr:MAG TPA: hypothetical protein [Caudoviricetes sp.]